MNTSRKVVVSSLVIMAAATAGYEVGQLKTSSEKPAGGPTLENRLQVEAEPTRLTSGGAPSDDPNTFVSLAKKTIPSVVNISTATQIKMPRNPFMEFYGFPGFGGGRGAELSARKTTALGTGFIIDASGIILTNHHVIAGADEIRIQFTEDPEEKPTEGRIIGRDPELDVALIQVSTSRKLTPLVLGNSDALQVGEYVMAVGNPFGNGHSVSHGIVSAKGRQSPGFPLAKYLQIDVPINPGNSGGPLLNLKGEVVGINNAIDARAQGIGFAIPINYAKNILPQLQAKGKVNRGYIGAMIAEDQELHAPVIVQVNHGTPADKAGLKSRDVIQEVDGKRVYSTSDLISAISSAPIGKSFSVKIQRDGKEKLIQIVTAERPDRA